MQDDVAQQLEAEEAAVAGLPGAAHSCGQGGQQVGCDCLVVGHHLLAELAQRLQALQQDCLQTTEEEEEDDEEEEQEKEEAEEEEEEEGRMRKAGFILTIFRRLITLMFVWLLRS